MRALERVPLNPSAQRMGITFEPMGASRRWPVATVWLENGFVRWSSPCLDDSHEHANVEVFEHAFGDCACTFPAFMRAMNWLDAVCFGATSLDAIRRACETNTEYGLACATEPGTGPEPAKPLPT